MPLVGYTTGLDRIQIYTRVAKNKTKQNKNKNKTKQKKPGSFVYELSSAKESKMSTKYTHVSKPEDASF